MMIGLLLVIVTLVTCDTCKGVNAQVNCELTDYDVNEYVDIGTKDGVRVTVLERFKKYNSKDWTVKETGTNLATMKMQYKKMDTVLRGVVATQRGITQFHLGRDVRALQLSNFEDIAVKVEFQDGYTANEGIVTLGVTTEKKDYFHVYFAAINQTARNLDFSRSMDFRNFVPAFRYRYPYTRISSNQTVPFNTYYKNGDIGPYEDSSDPKATEIIVTDTLAPQTKTIVMPSPDGNEIRMLTMMWTQESLKFMPYNWEFPMDTSGAGPSYLGDFPFLLVPKIADTTLKPNDEYSSYFVFDADEDKGCLFALVELNLDQAHGFETLQKMVNETVVSQFRGQPGPFPFLCKVCFDSNFNLDFKSAVNLLDGLSEKDFPKQAYGASLSVRDGIVVATSAPYLYRTMNGELAKYDPDTMGDLVGWVSVFSKGKMYTSTTLSEAVGYDKDNLPGIKSKKEKSFYPSSASWTVVDGTDNCLVGGFVFSYSDHYNKKARIFNMDVTDLTTMKITKMTDIGFSDRKSNELTGIVISDYKPSKKEKDQDNYRMFLKLLLDGPTSSDKSKQKCDADIWQVDCTTPNAGLEIFAKIVFFVFFGIAVVMFTFATCVFSIKACVKCGIRIAKKATGEKSSLQEDQKMKEDEAKRLLKEGEDIGEEHGHNVITEEDDLAPTLM